MADSKINSSHHNCRRMNELYAIGDTVVFQCGNTKKRRRYPNCFHQQKQVAKDGGSVAKAARTQLESKLGHGVISQAKASDYLPNIETNKE